MAGTHTWTLSPLFEFAEGFAAQTGWTWGHRVTFSAPIIFRAIDLVFGDTGGGLQWSGKVVIYDYGLGDEIYDSGINAYTPTTDGAYFEIGTTAGVPLLANEEYAIGFYGSFSSTPLPYLASDGLGGGSNPSSPGGLAGMAYTNDLYYTASDSFPSNHSASSSIIGRIKGDAPAAATNMKYFNGSTWVNATMNYNASGVWNDSPNVKGNF
jgi:hypothetical protein